ncbi:Hypothetical predicted protein, partial [Scomber scombrus]
PELHVLLDPHLDRDVELQETRRGLIIEVHLEGECNPEPHNSFTLHYYMYFSMQHRGGEDVGCCRGLTNRM